MMSKQQEQKWQAESDADTMARYQEILGDKARMRRAVKVAQKRAADLSKRATVMQNVASLRNGGRLNTISRSGSRSKTTGSKSASINRGRRK